MDAFDYTHPDPAVNLALEEVLLHELDRDSASGGILRFWESPMHFVVLGYSSPLSDVLEDACEKDHIAILRRVSGGGTVLQGPGCVNYSLIVPLNSLSEWKTLSCKLLKTATHAFANLGASVMGISDMAIAGKKFAGHAERRKPRALLFHGAILYAFHLACVAQYLAIPKRQPDYRKNRTHGDFIQNLSLPRQEIISRLSTAFGAELKPPALPLKKAEALAADKYSNRHFIYGASV